MTELIQYNNAPELPLKFLETIGTAEKIEKKLNDLLISDIKKIDIDQRDMLNVMITFLSQIIDKPEYRDYINHYIPQLTLDQIYIKTFKTFIKK